MPAGAPTKITPEIIEKLRSALATGCYVETAAGHAEIDRTTFQAWVKRGAKERDHRAKGGRPRKREELFYQLSIVIEKAIADAELTSLARINKAGRDGAWQADAWRLERRSPDRWGRRRVDVGGVKGAPIAVSWAELVETIEED